MCPGLSIQQVSGESEVHHVDGKCKSERENEPDSSFEPKSAQQKGKERGRYKTFPDRIADLKAFKEIHGHLNVPKKYDKSLFQFTATVKHAR